MEVCKYRSTQECSRFFLHDLEYAQFMHFCTTFKVKREGDSVTTKIKSYKDGKQVFEGACYSDFEGGWGYSSYGDASCFVKLLEFIFPHADVVLNRLDKYRSLKANGTLILGQDQDAVGGNFDADQALSGKLAQFGIWDYVLTSRDVEKMAECEEEGEKGKLVASFCKTCWLTGNWIDSYQILTFRRSSLCSAAVGTDIWVLIWANKKYTTMSSTYQQLVP